MKLEPQKDDYTNGETLDDEQSVANPTRNILAGLDENSPEAKYLKRQIEEGINNGYKIHMKHIKLHEKEM